LALAALALVLFGAYDSYPPHRHQVKVWCWVRRSGSRRKAEHEVEIGTILKCRLKRQQESEATRRCTRKNTK